MIKNFTLRVLTAFILLGSLVFAQELPKNPIAGRNVFEEEGCMNCHAVNGVGGTIGPDFWKHIFFGNGYELISKMWNHSSKMMLMMTRSKTKRPEFTGENFRDLGNFLFFLRYLGQEGSASAGKRLFVSKKCVDCHSIGRPIPGKIPLDSMKVYVSPVYLAQAMWNHSVEMHKKGVATRVKLPTFSKNEFADLTAYIRKASSFKSEKEIYSYPGDPAQGEKLFKEKGCYYCHVEKPVGPNLSRFNLNESVTTIAGVMWNHSDRMAVATKGLKMPYPTFSDNQMADVISYLYFEGSPKTTGSEKLGARLFREKGCESCHQAGNHFNAPTVDKFEPFNDKYDFFAALWNHAQRMEQLLFSQGKQLPKLLPNEVKSLYLFIDGKTKSAK